MLEIVERISIPVDVEESRLYTQIGVRSHGKGLFHKEPVTGKELGNKRVFWVKEDLFVVNIVFAWEQAVAKTTKDDFGTVASHRFPMLRPLPKFLELDFLLYFFLTKQGKFLLELASPGGAGRNKTLGQKAFDRTVISLPNVTEQKKIGKYLSAVDERINQLARKKALLLEYKKGMMQRIFDQTIRFKDDEGTAFSDWEEQSLSALVREGKIRNSSHQVEEVFSVAKNSGVINQLEHLGRSYAAEDTSRYKVVSPGDIVYTKSPTSEFPYGIIKQNKTGRAGIVSVLYAVFSPKTTQLGLLLDYYFSSWVKTYNYLNPIVQKGAKNTINIGNDDFLRGRKISLPTSTEEIGKIVGLLSALDTRIAHSETQLANSKTFKKALLQQMFV